jgi:hypothetical protein
MTPDPEPNAPLPASPASPRQSVVLARLIEEVRNEQRDGVRRSVYDRVHNRHNRSWHPK